MTVDRVGRINAALDTLAVPIDMLREDPANARTHSRRNLEAIAASLREFGQQKPVVAMDTGRIIAGNGTLQAAKAMGWTHLAVVRFDSEEAARATAYAIADNRTAELADWDADALSKTLDTLWAEAPELAGIGWTQEEVEAIREFGVDTPPAEPREFTEGDADAVEHLECPSCGHRWPK